jgi:hypothetical protein
VSARRWAQRPDPPAPPGWEPPPGFVSTRLTDDEPTTVVGDVEFEQPQLPLDDDATVARAEDTHVYPDPPWRNAGGEPGSSSPPDG